jgi:hypothetical protein
MPGPRNSKRQKKQKALKEKKRKESPVATPATAPPVDGDRTPENSWGGATPAGSPISHVEEVLLREPPIYDPGTGARVRSMGEFLRSGFASEPTWDDELCAEFAQEEMLEMLRTVLPHEMALVSTRDVIISPARFGLMRAVMKVRVVQQKQATFARVSSMLEDIPDGGCSSEPPSRARLAPDPAQGIPGVGGRAGDQRTLCASSLFNLPRLYFSNTNHSRRLNHLFRPRLTELSRGHPSHIWAGCRGDGGHHLGIP